MKPFRNIFNRRAIPGAAAACGSSGSSAASSSACKAKGMAGEGPGVADEGPGVAEEVPGVADKGPGVTDEGPGVTDEGPGGADKGTGVDDRGYLTYTGPGVAGGACRIYRRESVIAFTHRKRQCMRDTVTGIWPLPHMKVEQVICNHLLEVLQFQFLSGGPIQTIEVIAIDEAQLEQIEDGLLGPSICPPCNGIIIDHLIKLIDAPHIVHVLSDEFRPLHRHFFIDESPSSFHPSSVGEIFHAGVEPCADT